MKRTRILAVAMAASCSGVLFGLAPASHAVGSMCGGGGVTPGGTNPLPAPFDQVPLYASGDTSGGFVGVANSTGWAEVGGSTATPSAESSAQVNGTPATETVTASPSSASACAAGVGATS